MKSKCQAYVIYSDDISFQINVLLLPVNFDPNVIIHLLSQPSLIRQASHFMIFSLRRTSIALHGHYGRRCSRIV